MLKKTITIMAPLITHLTTKIIIRRKIPDILKIDRITPNHKKGKPIYDIGSLRPIKNLYTIEKVIEDYIIGHLEKYLHINKSLIKIIMGEEKGTAQSPHSIK